MATGCRHRMASRQPRSSERGRTPRMAQVHPPPAIPHNSLPFSPGCTPCPTPTPCNASCSTTPMCAATWSTSTPPGAPYWTPPLPRDGPSLLGEALAATVLLTATLKFAGSLILQVQGTGPLRTLVAQATHARTIRGLARWEGEVPAGRPDPGLRPRPPGTDPRARGRRALPGRRPSGRGQPGAGTGGLFRGLRAAPHPALARGHPGAGRRAPAPAPPGPRRATVTTGRASSPWRTP